MIKKQTIITVIVILGLLAAVRLFSESGRDWLRKDYHIQATHFYPYPAARPINLEDYEVIWSQAGFVHLVMTGDVDGDGETEVVTTNHQTLRVYDNTGNLKWSVDVVGGLGALADVTGDGVPEILLSYHKISNNQGAVLVFDGFGNLLKTLKGPTVRDGGFTRCWAEDFDHDGKIEVCVDVVASWSARPRGLYMFDYESANLEWFYAIGPYGYSRMGDVDEDGKLEFVFGGCSVHNGGSGAGVNNTATRTTDGDIYTMVFNAEDGSERFTLGYSPDGQSNGNVEHALVDLDHDGDNNILAFEGHSRWYHGTLQAHLIDENGSRLKTWNGPYLNYGDGHYVAWAVGDLTGDGLDEIVLNYTTVDGLWVLDHNLNEIKKRTFGRWLHHTADGYHIINDIDGDGINELIVADWYEGKIRVMDGQLNDIWVYPVTSGWFNIVLSDLDKDGINEIIVNGDDVVVLGIPTPPNNPPAVQPSGGGTYEVNTPVNLGGTVSDVDGDLLNYQWLEDSNVLFSGTIQTTAGGTPVTLPLHTLSTLSLGSHTITLQVDDGVNDPVSADIIVEIVDTTPPELNPAVSTSLLWPPNHKMVEVTVVANALDNSGLPVNLGASVSSNEAIDGLGDGDTSPDWTEPVIDHETGIIRLQLRAERSGKGDGRIYTITVTATDGSGNSASESVAVLVPHDKKKK